MTLLIVIIAISILILIHELGHFLTARMFGVKVEEFGFGFPPKIFSKKTSKTEYSLNLLPFGGFVKIYGENGEDIETPKGGFSSFSVWRRSVIVLAGVFMNIALGWLILSVIFFIGVPEHLLITNVSPKSPASEAGLKSGDVILETLVGNQNLKDPIASGDFIKLVKNNPENNLRLKIKRGENIINATALIRGTPPAGEGPLGVELIEVGIAGEPLPKNFSRAAETTIKTLGLLGVSFYRLFTGVFTHPEIIKSVTGPIGMFAMTSEASAMGIAYLLQLMALISFNLAVLNLIPFPALDGGRFLFLIIEKIRGRPITFKTQALVNSIGFGALLILMAVVTIKDINNLIH